jgi:hypothetical protein
LETPVWLSTIKPGYLAASSSKPRYERKCGTLTPAELLSKGYFSGTYNAIAGRVRKGATEVGEISGKWSHQMYYTDLQVTYPAIAKDGVSEIDQQTGQRRELFDADRASVMPKVCLPEDKQEKNESRRYCLLEKGTAFY